MNYWLCPECKRKISENIKVCPHCKISNPKFIPDIGSNTSNSKIIIAVVSMIIISGIAYFAMAPKDQNVQQSKPKYIVQTVPVVDSATHITPVDTKNSGKVVPALAMDAFKSLKKLEAATQSGVAVKDYSPLLIEAKLTLNLFTESSSSKDFPALLESMKSAFETYSMAGNIWNDKFNGNKAFDGAVHISYHPEIFSKYPDAKKTSMEGGILYITDKGAEYIMIDTAISWLFSRAGEELKKTSSMIST